ncbi:MAG: hypothetical protein JWL81_1975 [Verrucomicrobiales bacterium]|nr:hypothetical protein [Verrucomicrobiales bacterium]
MDKPLSLTAVQSAKPETPLAKFPNFQFVHLLIS